MAATMKPASADTVRAWAAEEGWTDEFGRAPKDRGRLPTSLIAEFDKAHRRNRLQYTPGYKDDTSEQTSRGASNSGGGGGGNSRAVATREPATTRPKSRNSGNAQGRKDTEKATAAAPARQSREEASEPIRVEAKRVAADVADELPVQSINIEDAIALLTSAAAARKKGDAPPALIAVYTLV